MGAISSRYKSNGQTVRSKILTCFSLVLNLTGVKAFDFIDNRGIISALFF